MNWIKNSPSNTTLFTMFNKTLIIRYLSHIVKVLLNIVNSVVFDGLFLSSDSTGLGYGRVAGFYHHASGLSLSLQAREFLK
jgi:hypothetical protein